MDPSTFNTVKERLQLEEFGISDRIGLVKKRLAALSQVLRANLNFADSWSDVARCLAEMYAFAGDSAFLDK